MIVATIIMSEIKMWYNIRFATAKMIVFRYWQYFTLFEAFRVGIFIFAVANLMLYHILISYIIIVATIIILPIYYILAYKLI